MKHKLLIFDWDGTLVDSAHHIVDCIKVACKATGEIFPGQEAAKNIIGLGMHEALVELFGARDEKFTKAFRRAYSEHFFATELDRGNLFPGVLEALEELRGMGYQLAIATGKSRLGMDRVLKSMHMETCFSAIRCADETSSKPDPLMLRELLKEFELATDQAVMIGDTEYDMDMAKRINMPRIAVSYGVHEIERMRVFEPGGIADTPLELVDVIGSFELENGTETPSKQTLN
jgi:phosphoglycolate phosphatase